MLRKLLRQMFAVCLFLAGVCFVILVFTSSIHLIHRAVLTNTTILDFQLFLEHGQLNATFQESLQSSGTTELQSSDEGHGVQNCTMRKVKLSDHKLPVTALLSFPGSGNTWTRHLIQQMSGLGTSSMYCDSKLRLNGFPYECNREFSKAVVVKTHEYRHLKNKKFSKVVLLIRNPYEAILSQANYLKSGHTGKAPIQLIKQVNQFNHSLVWYLRLTQLTANNFSGPVHILQYEKLETELSDTLWKLAKFLKLNLTLADIECTVKLQEGNFHRKTSKDKHLQLLKQMYNKDQLIRLKEAADSTEKLVKDTYGIDLDVGSPLGRVLLKHVTT